MCVVRVLILEKNNNDVSIIDETFTKETPSLFLRSIMLEKIPRILNNFSKDKLHARGVLNLGRKHSVTTRLVADVNNSIELVNYSKIKLIFSH